MMGRRSFLKYSAAVTLAGALPVRSIPAADKKKDRKWHKAVMIGMLPGNLPDAEKFKLARKCGYDGIEGSPMDDLNAAREQGKLARETGVPIHGLLFGGWHAPFSDPNPEVVKKGLEGMKNALRCANAMVPAQCCWCLLSSMRMLATVTPISVRRNTSISCCLWRKK